MFQFGAGCYIKVLLISRKELHLFTEIRAECNRNRLLKMYSKIRDRLENKQEMNGSGLNTKTASAGNMYFKTV